MNKSKLIRWSVPIAVLVLLWVIPTPEGLTPAAWHMFAIFAATIAGILAAPVASGALMFIALAITYFTNTLPLNDVLKGFASGTVWMIFRPTCFHLASYSLVLGDELLIVHYHFSADPHWVLPTRLVLPTSSWLLRCRLLRLVRAASSCRLQSPSMKCWVLSRDRQGSASGIS